MQFLKQHRSRTSTMRWLFNFLITASAVVFHHVYAFQLSMLSSTTQRSSRNASTSSSSRSSSSRVFQQSLQKFAPFAPPLPVPPIPGGLSSNLISQLAVMALKHRLKAHTDVTCDVTSRSSDLLLFGKVGPVTVKGKGWQSGLGLTCRAIEATVDSCELDVARILSQRKLSLIHPAKGRAMVALNSIDFANFITHPLMKPPSSINGSAITFLKEGAQIDVKAGAVTFYAKHNGAQWKCALQRSQVEGRRATIQVTPMEPIVDETSDVLASQISQVLSNFFNEMVFELDGTFLSFRDMMVTDNKGNAPPSVTLALNIVVHKFPSRSLAF